MEPGLKFDRLHNLVCKNIMIFWTIYFSEIFWKHSKNVSPLVSHNYKFFLGLSACFAAYFFTENRQI